MKTFQCICPSTAKLLHTSVYAGEPSPEVHQRRQLLDAILLGIACVSDLDKGDVQVISLIINLLQLFKNLLALGIVFI